MARYLLVTLLLVSLTATAFASENIQIENLRCEYLINPLGIDETKPRLSWELKSDHRGQKQTAYCLLVASSKDLLDNDKGDLWDSGKVNSDRSIHIFYNGKPLASRIQCFWKVKVWDKDSKASKWSNPAMWSMGLLDENDWKAKWITMKDPNGIPHPWLRRTFELKSDPVDARVYVNTPSHYELYINGQKVSKDVLAPAHVHIKKRFFYNIYDVSRYLQKGSNCIALWMGPGWYQRYSPHRTIVRAQLEVRTADGMSVISSDRQWRLADSCISQIGKWKHRDFGGERFDAGKYIEDWNQTTFDDSGWASALEISAPSVENSWQALPPSRTRPPIRPKKIYRHKNKWVVDFGTTLDGWLRLRMSALKPGQEITIDYADTNDPRHSQSSAKDDGLQTFNQRDIYIAGNKEEGVFCSKFNYHGFRYAVISGLSQEPTADDAEAMMVMTDLKKAGDFRCSNDLLNRIHQVTVNNYHTQIPCGVLGAGEAREKLGYGDGGSFLTGMLYNLQSDAFFQKWSRDWCDIQRANGFIGHHAPEHGRSGGGPSWGAQASQLVRRLSLYYGDRRAVAVAYPVLKKFVDHLESHTDKQDILRYFNPYQPGTYQKWYFLADWLPPRPNAEEHGFTFGTEIDREFFNNCYRIMLWQHLADYAEIMGDHDEVKRCQDRLTVLRPLIHKTYFDFEKNTYKANRQAYLTISLYSRVVPPELRPAIFRQLENDIVKTRNGHLDTGLQGTFMMLDLLIKENRNDLVAMIMNQTTFPGWGYLIEECNMTSWPESWSGWGSQIIQVVGTPGSWFFEGLGGILPDPKQPGFKHFTLRPGVVKSVDWVKCSYQSPYGQIVSNWKLENGSFTWDISVPVNSTATVYLPARDYKSMTESSKPVKKAKGVKFLRMENDKAVLSVESGTYKFVSKYE